MTRVEHRIVVAMGLCLLMLVILVLVVYFSGRDASSWQEEASAWSPLDSVDERAVEDAGWVEPEAANGDLLNMPISAGLLRVDLASEEEAGDSPPITETLSRALAVGEKGPSGGLDGVSRGQVASESGTETNTVRDAPKADGYALASGVVQEGLQLPQLFLNLSFQDMMALERAGGGRMVLLAYRGNSRVSLVVDLASAVGSPRLFEDREVIKRLGQRALRMGIDARQKERIMYDLRLNGFDRGEVWFYLDALLDKRLADAQLQALRSAGVEPEGIGTIGKRVETYANILLCNGQVHSYITEVLVDGRSLGYVAQSGCGG